MTEERHPKAPLETPARDSATISRSVVKALPLPPVTVIELDYLTLSPREKAVYDCAEYWTGVRCFNEGFAAGRAERIAEEEAAWSSMAASIRAAGRPFVGIRFSALAELRGEREAADLARVRERLLFEREAS